MTIVSNLWFAITDNLGNRYNAVSTDKNGEATVKGLRVYDDKGNKITYTVKAGFKTSLGAHSYGGYTWTIKKEKMQSATKAHIMKVFQMPYSAIVRMLIQDTTMANHQTKNPTLTVSH